MDGLLPLVKPIDAPGSIPFLILCVAFGLIVMFVWPRHRRFGRLWLTGVGCGYLLLALPCVAHAIANRLPRVEPDRLAPGQPLDTLIVFDGDNRRGRVREAVRAWRAGAPGDVWVLGLQDWLMSELPAAGIPRQILRYDSGTGTTREQIGWVRRYVSANPGARIAIVASRLQMPRVAALARTVRIDALLLASEVDDEPPARGAKVVVPMYIALRVSRDALYEHAALVYYRRKGWIGN
jgi:hypothetical protein